MNVAILGISYYQTLSKYVQTNTTLLPKRSLFFRPFGATGSSTGIHSGGIVDTFDMQLSDRMSALSLHEIIEISADLFEINIYPSEFHFPHQQSRSDQIRTRSGSIIINNQQPRGKEIKLFCFHRKWLYVVTVLAHTTNYFVFRVPLSIPSSNIQVFEITEEDLSVGVSLQEQEVRKIAKRVDGASYHCASSRRIIQVPFQVHL